LARQWQVSIFLSITKFALCLSPGANAIEIKQFFKCLFHLRFSATPEIVGTHSFKKIDTFQNKCFCAHKKRGSRQIRLTGSVGPKVRAWPTRRASKKHFSARFLPIGLIT